jgi:uncharacterized protein (TIGR00369 family)
MSKTIGPSPHELARSTPAIELFRAVLAGRLPAPPIGRSLDFHLAEVEPGRVVFAGSPSERFYNPTGTVHGGWIAALLDSCMTGAVHSTLPAGQTCATVEVKISFLRPLTAATGSVTAEGGVINLGRTIATAEGRLRDGAGELLAHGTTTVIIVPL